MLDYLVRGVNNTALGIQRIAPVRRTPRQVYIYRMAASPAFRVMSDALELSLRGERARLVHILYNWVRKIYLWVTACRRQTRAT